MCLAKPLKIKAIEGIVAIVESASGDRKINIAVVPELRVGDWILAEANIAVEKISNEEAIELNNLLTQKYEK